MGSSKTNQELTDDNDEFAGWDPRKEDYMSRQNSTIYGANFTRTNNLARNKEVVHETQGLYVKNIPLDLNESSLLNMLSEHGKVLSVHIGKPNAEFAARNLNITWGIVKVENMKVAMSIISAYNLKPPMNLRIGLSLSDEELERRRRDRVLAKSNQEEMEVLVSRRVNTDVFQQKSPIVSDQPQVGANGSMGRGKKLLSLGREPGVNAVGLNQPVSSQDVGGSIGDDKLLSPLSVSVSSLPVKEVPIEKVVVETNIGNMYVEWRQPRPCVAEGCSAMGKLRCSVCKAYYCSKECQVDDWFYHSRHCKMPPPLEDCHLAPSKALPDKVPSMKQCHAEPMLKRDDAFLNKGPLDISSDGKEDLKAVPFKKESIRKFSESRNANNRMPDEIDGLVMTVSHGRNRLTGLGHEHLRRPFQKEDGKPLSKSVQEVGLCVDKALNPGIDVSKQGSGISLDNNSVIESVGKSEIAKTVATDSAKQASSVVAMPKVSSDTLSSNMDKGGSEAVVGEAIKCDTKLPVDSGKDVNKVLPAIDSEDLPVLVDQIELNCSLIGLLTLRESCKHFTVLVMAESAGLLLGETHAVLEGSPFDPNFEPVIGSLVAAKSVADSSWYRAFLYAKEADQFSVIYIDFGNKEMVKVIKALPAGQFSSLPGLAMDAKLHGDVNSDAEKLLEEMIVVDEQVTMKVIAKKAKSLKVSLVENGGDSVVAHFILRPWYTTLLQSKAVDRSTDSKSLARNVNDRPPLDQSVAAKVNHNLSVSPSKFIEISPECRMEKSPAKSVSASKQEMKIPEESSSTKFWYPDLRKTDLSPDQDYDVIPVWVGQDNALYVHLVSEAIQLQSQELLLSINEHCEKAGLPSSLEIGELVCGFLEADNAWYRSEVKELKNDQITAHFVDFGNSDVLLRKNLRTFSTELLKTPITAVRVKLARISTHDVEIKTQLVALVEAGQILRMRSLAGELSLFEIFDKEILLNDLITNDLNVKKLEALPTGSRVEEVKTLSPVKDVSSSPPVKKELPRGGVPMYEDCKTSPLKVGKDVDIVVIHTSGPHTMFIVARDSIELYDDLEKLNVIIKDYCNSFSGSLYRPQQGEMCLAKFSEDGLWYRAACVQPGLESSFVIFADYGNTEEVKMSDLRQITDRFLDVPCIALHSILKGVSPDGVQIGAKDRLEQLLPQNTLVKADVDVDDGVYIIDLPSISKTLISEGLVKAE